MFWHISYVFRPAIVDDFRQLLTEFVTFGLLLDRDIHRVCHWAVFNWIDQFKLPTPRLALLWLKDLFAWTVDTRRPRAPVATSIVASNAIEDRKSLFRFEWCSYPSALFDDTLMPRAPQKAALSKAIWTRLQPDIAGPTGEVQHVLDGGALLHRITWPHWFPTYQDICVLNCDYVSRNFGPAIVVFDSYRIPSTNYTTHQRRTGVYVGIEVTFTGDMKLTMSKDVFLSNVANKQNFTDMLSHYLQLAGCLTEHAEEDADLLIAQTAVQSAATKNTVLVADDTDPVILLCYYSDPDGFELFM